MAKSTKTPRPDPNAAYGAQPRPKYETKQEDLPAQDVLVSSVPGSEDSRRLDSPESPHLGDRYVPGSANTTATRDQFTDVSNRA